MIQQQQQQQQQQQWQEKINAKEINTKDVYEYYTNETIQETIFYQVIHKEVSLLSNQLKLRLLYFKKPTFMNLLLNYYSFHAKKTNLYYSLANYTTIPPLSFRLNERTTQSRKFWQNPPYQSFDIGLDFDNHDNTKHDSVINETLNTSKFLEYHNITHSINWSGKGTHILISAEDNYTLNDNLDFQKKLMTQLPKILQQKLQLKTLDTKMEYAKLWKIPYTIDFKTNTIALPLTQKMLCLTQTQIRELTKFENIKETIKLKKILNIPTINGKKGELTNLWQKLNNEENQNEKTRAT